MHMSNSGRKKYADVQREIERKFLVTKVPKDLRQFKRAEITQGCLAIRNGNGGNAIRIRRKEVGERVEHYVTVKRRIGKGGLERYENDVPITPMAYDRLSKSIMGTMLRKTRYYIPDRKNTIELDVYSGSLKGLVVAEVEFKHMGKAQTYVPPKWMHKEITGIKGYSNWSLALNGLPKNAKLLRER